MKDRTPHTVVLQQVANVYDLPFALLEAQVIAESSGDANAFRYEHEFFERYVVAKSAVAGAQYGPLAACSYGLLQIILTVAMELGFDGRPEQLFTPQVGAAWGAKKMQALLAASNGDYDQALARYNGGAGGNLTRPFRNQAYVDRVRSQIAP